MAQARDATQPLRSYTKFSPADDDRLRLLVQSTNQCDWNVISDQMNGKNARQCKERWLKYLSPGLNASTWTPDEDRLLLKLHAQLGAKWTRIAQFLATRTDTMIKNRFNKLSRQEKKKKELLTMCDPRLLDAVFGQPAGNADTPPATQAAEPQHTQQVQSQDWTWGDATDCDWDHDFL
jgi:hypothetical protein